MIRFHSPTAVLLPVAIAIGLTVGMACPNAGESFSVWIDPLVLTLLGLIFFEVRLSPLREASRHLRFLSLAWVANFFVVPLLGWGIASVFFKDQTALSTGLLLYLLFPCTDWFLGFTRMARGDVALGTILLPINLLSQILLYPLYLTAFIGPIADINRTSLWGMVIYWFIVPLAVAWVARIVLRRTLKRAHFEKLAQMTGTMVPWVLSALVLSIFVCHTSTITEHLGAFAWILLAVFLFFVVTWILGELLARKFQLSHPQHVLLSMTTAARNAPLILGLTAVAMPDQPLVYAALIIGMLVEFPHLTMLSLMLDRKDRPAKSLVNQSSAVS
ncbi:MAG: arsenic resistance protein [Verrucomicrobiales bacterium]